MEKIKFLNLSAILILLLISLAGLISACDENEMNMNEMNMMSGNVMADTWGINLTSLSFVREILFIIALILLIIFLFNKITKKQK